jgi:hypothetical protein
LIPLCYRQVSVVDEEFAVSKDGMEKFGVLDLATAFEGCRFAIGTALGQFANFAQSRPLSFPVRLTGGGGSDTPSDTPNS